MNNLKNYSIGLEPEQLERLNYIKQETGATIQWQIRTAINNYINDRDTISEASKAIDDTIKNVKALRSQIIDSGAKIDSAIISAFDQLIEGGQNV
jgi:predicted DNA-binding protein